MTTTRPARPEVPTAMGWDGGGVAGFGSGLAGAGAGVGATFVAVGVGLEAGLGLAVTVAVAGAAGLGLWRESVRRWGAPVQAPTIMGTSSTIAARRARDLTTAATIPPT